MGWERGKGLEVLSPGNPGTVVDLSVLAPLHLIKSYVRVCVCVCVCTVATALISSVQYTAVNVGLSVFS